MIAMKELPLFKVGNYYGYNQELFTDHWMNTGDCGAVTACDVSIYLDLNQGFSRLYPYDIHHLTAQDYINFSQIMKPFLRPRQNGIDTLELWIQGYSNYLRSVGEQRITMHGLYSDCPLKELESAVKWEIDHNLPVPYLNLKHANPDLAAYVWHWFWLAGYVQYEDTFLVKLVTYGSFRWFSLEELWNSGYKRKGGVILLDVTKKGREE